MNGYLWCNGPGLTMRAGERRVWGGGVLGHGPESRDQQPWAASTPPNPHPSVHPPTPPPTHTPPPHPKNPSPDRAASLGSEDAIHTPPLGTPTCNPTHTHPPTCPPLGCAGTPRPWAARTQSTPPTGTASFSTTRAATGWTRCVAWGLWFTVRAQGIGFRRFRRLERCLSGGPGALS